MTWPVLLAVLCGALLHAGWNAVVKSSSDKAADTALVHVMAALLGLPLLLWLGLPRAESWPFIAASLLLHLGYYIALAGAYEHGELGLTYPIMRGFAPLLVALASAAVVGEVPSAAAWLGILGITLGVAMVGLAHPGEALHHGKALGFAFANAAIIACYTLVDGLGVRAAQDALRYVLLLTVIDAVPFLLLVLWQRRGRGHAHLWRYARARWPVATVAGVASVGSYAIALWAMTHAPVASVAALRETSVLFAAVIGTFMLKERFGWQRAGGTCVIVAGVVALRLG
jgi:phosphonate utilization associated putative membrane protein